MTFETLLIGILMAVLYVEVFDIYPGGIIVPAYIALYLDQPLRVLATILIALLSLLTYRILSRFLILFGRRRFVTMILVGVLWAQLWFLLIPHLFTSSIELRAIGWLIPGLLANNLEKQKFFLTLASLLTVSILAFFLVRVILWLIP
jgi:poly-gamma-glutamate biosynthesis protein PgsC/CapC